MHRPTLEALCPALALRRCSTGGVLSSDTTPRPTLTARERAVLALLADGYRYEQIAMRLEISLGTVRTHVVRMYRKLGVSTKSEAAARGLRLGLLA